MFHAWLSYVELGADGAIDGTLGTELEAREGLENTEEDESYTGGGRGNLCTALPFRRLLDQKDDNIV